MKVPTFVRDAALRLFARSETSAAGESLPVQTAALPWRRDPSGSIEVLLVTGRSSGKWIVPKGWPMRGKSLAEAAAIEAEEEAGVEGVVSQTACGEFVHNKEQRGLGEIRFLVRVYPLKVLKLRDAWPEQSERSRAWFSPSAAADAAASPKLAELLRRFEP